ncbi:MAG: HD domain-containing protein [Anaerolineaceae bacterium]|nr:HD domain-containing protein [Anaerolineaceae bacterium]
MIQITRHSETREDIPTILHEFRSYPVSKSLLFLFMEFLPEDEAAAVIRFIQSEIPGLPVVGSTSFGGVGYSADKVYPQRFIFSFLSFEEAGAKIVYTDLDRSTEWQAAMETNLTFADLPNLKGIFLLTAGLETRVQVYMDKVHNSFSSIPLFGMSASSGSIVPFDYPSFIFSGDHISDHAIAAVAFYGKDLHIEANDEFGWTPLGRKMTVTKVGPEIIVHEIDNQPAVNIYKRYLGLNPNQITVENTCEFPVFKVSGEHRMARISNEACENGAIRFGAPLAVGDEIRFSYGNPPDILRETEQNVRKLSAFAPQAMFVIGCLNRILFLNEDGEKELSWFPQVFPDALVLHGNSEFFMDHSGGGELNSALVFAVLREGESAHKDAVNSLPHTQSHNEEMISFARRLLTFLDVTTHELENLRENLSEEVDRKTEEIIRQQNELNQAHLRIVMTLSNAIDAKDAYTNGHSLRVAKYAAEIAKRFGYDQHRQDEVYMIGLLHDVGKIGVPDAIINKPGRLTDEEFAEIRKHPAIGAEILSAITEFPQIAYGAHWHHERWDGRGYPDGLKGEAIPEIAQIISVADAYDAMTSTRSYRTVMSREKVRSEIEKGRGTQFSPRFADIMLEMIDEDPDYTMRGNTLKSEKSEV